MSLKLKHSEDFSTGLKRILVSEGQKCIDLLEKNTPAKRHETVHELRKSFKKSRAVLRLVRGQADFYKEENRFYRDLGRTISEVRDATSMIEALDTLIEQYDDQLYNHTFQTLKRGLVDYREELSRLVFDQEDRLKHIEESLRQKLEEIPGWRLEVDSFKHIVPGMEKTYARGYHGLAKAGKKSKDENLHEWRKRAKYLRYHFKILDRLWPAMLDTLEDELHDITDYLGMAHDLEILEQTILDERIPFKNDESATLFFALLHEQKNALQKRALMRGQKVFVDDPDEFVRKMGLYWKLHKQKLENAAAS